MKGVIKKLNENGFGFISIEGQPKDLFFHANDCTEGNFKQMQEGDAVSFDMAESAKGPNAINVVLDTGAESAANNNDGFAGEEEQAA